MPNLIISDIQVRQDAEGRYSLNDLHKAAGGEAKHKPANFLRLDSTQGLIAEIDQFSEMRSAETINGGAAPGTFVCRELVYAYAMWINPAFHLKVIRAYDAMMTQAHTSPAPEMSATLQTALCHEAHRLAAEGYESILAELSERARHYLRTGIPEADILDCLKRKAFGRASPVQPKDLKPLLARFGELFDSLNDLVEGGSELYAKRLR